MAGCRERALSLQLLAACNPGEIRLALADGDRLLDYALWRPGAPDGIDDLHHGRIERVLPALGGAFVALEGGVSGFLPLADTAGRPGNGDAVRVRVVRAAQGGKGPRLKAEPPGTGPDDAPGTGSPCLLARGPDPLARLLAAHPDADIVADDPSLAAEHAPQLRGRIRLAARAIPDAIEAQIEALSEAEIALPGGMRASLHPTPALVAIDMDGAGASSGRQPKATAQFAANRLALPPLLHQLRLRNLSGAVLIDLAGLPSRKRPALRPGIEQALALDPLQPRLLGFTALGLCEILRPRIAPPLHELLAGPHAAALAALRAAARFASAPPHHLPRLRAGIGVAAALDRDPAALAALARRAGRPLAVRTDPSMPADAWILEHG